MRDLYILDENHNPKLTKNLEEWIDFSDDIARCKVEETQVGPYRVSTIFMGIDDGLHRGRPVLFETTIFPDCVYQERCCTWGQALAMHRVAVAYAEKLLGN